MKGLTPSVSVIIPLSDDRGRGLDCIKSWTQEQTYAQNKIEVIAISNGSTPELERQVKELMRPQDALLFAGSTNEFFHYHVGALHAKGELLFFTEAHTVATSDCLAEMVRFLTEHNCNAARCAVINAPDDNWLKRMEDRVFGESFHVALQEDHWLKVDVNGFAIPRDVYLAEGGFEHEFGQFAEWALAAKLHSRGRRLSYAPTSTVYHYALGNLSELTSFIRDFTQGEIGYRARYPADYCERYFGPSPEWSERESYRAVTARSLCQTLIRNIPRSLRSGQPGDTLQAQVRGLLRFGPTAVFGPRWSMLQARLARSFALAQMWLWRLDGERCYRAYREHWGSIIRYCRLEAMTDYLAASAPALPETHYHDLAKIEEERLVGFHAVEEWQGNAFRWSEPVALVKVSLARSTYRVELNLLEAVWE